MAEEEELIARLRVAGVQGFRAGMRQAAGSLGDLREGVGRVEAKMHLMENAGRKTVGQMKVLATGAAGLGVALGAGIVSSTVQFDRAMRNVNSIAHMTDGRLQSMSRSLIALAGQTGQSPKVLAEGLYDLVSSGFNASQSLHILRHSARAASAGLTDTKTSTKAVAAILNAYHLPAARAGKVSDQLFQIVNRGVVSFGELANTIGDVLPFAASLHVGLDQVGASVATMTKAGISPWETMTRLKSIMEALIKPSNAMAKTLTGLGYQSGEALIHAKGFQGALDVLAKSAGGSKQKMAELFPNIRALGGALALTGANSKAAADDVKGMANVHGATSKALAEQAKSVSYQWDRLKETARGLGIEVGMKLIPKMRNLVQDLTGFVHGMEHGTGAGGRFADKLSAIYNAAKPVAQFLKDHPRLIAVAVGAWATYKAATVVALAAINVQRFRQVFMKSVPAAGEAGAAAGASYSEAFSATSSRGVTAAAGKGGRLRGVFGAVGRGLGVYMAAQLVDSLIPNIVRSTDPGKIVDDLLHNKAPDPGRGQNPGQQLHDITRPGGSQNPLGGIIHTIGGLFHARGGRIERWGVVGEDGPEVIEAPGYNVRTAAQTRALGRWGARMGDRPPALAGGALVALTVPVMLDGREVGRGMAKVAARDVRRL